MVDDIQVTTIGEKGQVVIPLSIRKELAIKPKTKFIVLGRGDIVILKKLELSDLKKDWDGIFKMMDKKDLKLSIEEIQEENSAEKRIGK
jgi:AbrB family looped-hinge helix DNA binding protein